MNLKEIVTLNDNRDIYYALLDYTQELAAEKARNESKKKLYYISAEFLIGKLLSNNLINLGIYDEVKTLLEENGKSLAEIEAIEPEPSLGNGGLGRLAACFLDSIATLGLSGQIPVWMQVKEGIRETASTYFFILYTPMLLRTATIIFGTVLRAAGDTKTPMKIGVVVNLTNVVLNFLLIYPTRPMFGGAFTMPGAGMGVIGAALASAIAFAVGGMMITVVLWRHPYISPKGQKLTPDMQILRPCLRVAFPNMLQRFGTSLGYVAFASMINSLGEVATAAHTIANTVESAFYIPGYGMQTAAATLAGNAYGADDADRMKRLAKMFIPIEIGLMIFSGGALFISAPMLVQIFSSSEEVIVLGTTVLRMVALSEPFYGFSIIIEGMMQGVGRTKQPFVFNIVGMWMIRIVGTFICTQMLGYGLVSAWACMIAHNMFLFVMFLICYVRGTWNPLHEKHGG